MENEYRLCIQKGKQILQGAFINPEEAVFCFEADPKASPVTLELLDAADHSLITRIVMDDYRIGGYLCCVRVQGLSGRPVVYRYTGRYGVMTDSYARAMAEPLPWLGEQGDRCLYRPWAENEIEGITPSPEIDYSETVMYKLHVRGFTAAREGLDQRAGTFEGVIERLPYLKKLGVNCLDLMPAYEFNEHSGSSLNYWGYAGQDPQYFIPKSAYAAAGDGPESFKKMMEAAHSAGIRVVMEMLFDARVTSMLALECLRHWVLAYGVDGFILHGSTIPVEFAAKDPLLKKTWLICSGMDAQTFYGGRIPDHRVLGCKNDDFRWDIRRFLRGDAGSQGGFVWHFLRDDDFAAPIQSITSNNGFTLADLVSYEHRHNEANGENNMDGWEDDVSWNCGAEGPSRKKAVRELREHQMRNAAMMLLLARGVPEIYAGDEFGNSQGGNNNAYCQDNAVSWLDWRDTRRHKAFLDFVRELIGLRMAHPVLRGGKPLQHKDYIGCGQPDVSLHGRQPGSTDPQDRYVGIMLCGDYCRTADGTPDDTFYLAWNMDRNEEASVLLPAVRDHEWVPVISSGDLPECTKHGWGIQMKISPMTAAVLKSTARPTGPVRGRRGPIK